MYIIELERTRKKLSRGGVTVWGITVSIRRPIQGKAHATDLLAVRFFQGEDAGVQFKGDAGYACIRLPETAAEKEVKP